MNQEQLDTLEDEIENLRKALARDFPATKDGRPGAVVVPYTAAQIEAADELMRQIEEKEKIRDIAVARRCES